MEAIEDKPVIAVLELIVNNHPGVMSHICGLFSRRAYNLEGIICIPLGGGLTSKMWLQVNEELKLEQIIKQVQKLPDVLNVIKHGEGHPVFAEVAALV
ncbi:MAG: acetolactate synthase isozyme 1 small subunit [Desulfotalea sp.]|nr:MAG: acetolactate synthase isozyme 1 small subunit [Desulfotalea sp.]